LLNIIIGIVILLVGLYLMFTFLGSSPSLKKRDEHNKNNPIDDSIYPPNSGGH
jgi:flagellar basal body-associated protein FliL